MRLCIERQSGQKWDIEELKEFFEQIYENIHGPRPGRAATELPEPTEAERELQDFCKVWDRLIPPGEWRCVDELSDKYYDRQGIRGTNFRDPPECIWW